MDNRDVLQSIAKTIDNPSAFFTFALLSKKCYNSAKLLVTDKKEQFKSLQIGMKSDNDDLVGGHFVLPNGELCSRNVVLVDSDGHFEEYTNTDVIEFAHGFQGDFVCKYENVNLANKVFEQFKNGNTL